MSERKVLNKYYPPDFDPSKIPRLRLPKNRQYTVRLMAPCNMRCTTCGEYIYKGKKFNARKETVENEEYLGTKVFRFYIKCPRCLSEITFKTDPANADYTVEHGATRNFQALKLAEEQAEREAREEEEEEKSNPMKLLEKRTKTSKQEMEILEGLEDLKDVNQRQARVDYEVLFSQLEAQQQAELERQEREDEEFVRSIFGKREADGTSDSGELKIKMLDEDSDEELKTSKRPRFSEKPSLVPEGLANKPMDKEKDLKSLLTSGPFAIRVKSKTAESESKEAENGSPKALAAPSVYNNAPPPSNGHTLSLCDYSDSESESS